HIVDEGSFIVNLQDSRERLRYEREPGLLIRELQAIKGEGKIFVFIDEIQKVPSILDDVQLLYDKAKERYQFYITGSSARKLKYSSANLLPGRSHLYHLSPVLLNEIDHGKESLVLPIHEIKGKRNQRFPRRSLEDILIYGNLPGLFSEPKASRVRTLAAYTELYIEEEIRKEALARDIGGFARFLQIAAMEAGQIVNITKLSHDCHIPVNTIKGYYQLLEDTFIGIRIPAFGRSRKRILTSPRFLFFDLGVRNALSELPLDDTLLKFDPGHLFEMWVLAELWHRCQYLRPGCKLTHWRAVSGTEVDAVIELRGKAIPVEIKWTMNPKPTDATHVERFMEIHKDLTDKGYIICRCPNPQQLTDRVIAVPWEYI
ncbi:MAG: ATP-binding protein, partial [bacterium]